MSVWLVCAAAGCAAGVLAGVLGIGGGRVVVPARVFAFTREQRPGEVALPRVFAGVLLVLAFRLAA